MKDIIDFLSERLKTSKTVKVFIPFNLWVEMDYKDEWIKALCEFSKVEGNKVTVIYGEIPPISNKNAIQRYNRRLDWMRDSDIVLVEVPPKKEAVSGFIIFDDVAVAGYGGEYFILEEDVEITLLSLGFDSLVRGINARS